MLQKLRDGVLGNQRETQFEFMLVSDVKDEILLTFHFRDRPACRLFHCLHAHHPVLSLKNHRTDLFYLQLTRFAPRELHSLLLLLNRKETQISGRNIVLIGVVERITKRRFQFVGLYVFGDGDAEGLLVVQQQEPLVDLAVVEIRLVINETFHRRLIL
jgi:hypothetical protein